MIGGLVVACLVSKLVVFELTMRRNIRCNSIQSLYVLQFEVMIYL